MTECEYVCSGEITTHFGVVKDAGHELSQKIAALHTYFQVRQTPAGSAMVDMKINCAMPVVTTTKSSEKIEGFIYVCNS